MSDFANAALERMNENTEKTLAKIRQGLDAPEQSGHNSAIQLSHGVTLNSYSLTLPKNLKRAEWLTVAGELRNFEESINWWIGDLILYGEKKYGETYYQAIDIFNKPYETLMNIVSVCRHFEISRRRENLSFSHHAAVMGLPVKEQDRLFDECVAPIPVTGRPLSVKILRLMVKEHLARLEQADNPAATVTDKPPEKPSGATPIILGAPMLETIGGVSIVMNDVEAALRESEITQAEQHYIIKIWRMGE